MKTFKHFCEAKIQLPPFMYRAVDGGYAMFKEIQEQGLLPNWKFSERESQSYYDIVPNKLYIFMADDPEKTERFLPGSFATLLRFPTPKDAFHTTRGYYVSTIAIPASKIMVRLDKNWTTEWAKITSCVHDDQFGIIRRSELKRPPR